MLSGVIWVFITLSSCFILHCKRYGVNISGNPQTSRDFLQ
jgi:hypothetical protein